MTNLTDRTALKSQRERAKSSFVDFLQVAAADEVQERLSEVNRTFNSTALVTGWPNVWTDRIDAKVVSDEDVLELEPASHDLVIHSMSLHWSNDIVG